jgi:hypothetical protein
MADNLRGVEALYRVVNVMRDEFLSNPFCNTCTIGTLTEIDLAKQTMFPLAHITIENVTHYDNSLSFQMTIFNLDIVSISKDLPVVETPNNNILGYGNDNLMFVLTNQLYVINRAVARMMSSTIYLNGWQLEGNPMSEVINKEMENMLAGYQTTLTLTVPNDIDKC